MLFSTLPLVLDKALAQQAAADAKYVLSFYPDVDVAELSAKAGESAATAAN